MADLDIAALRKHLAWFDGPNRSQHYQAVYHLNTNAVANARALLDAAEQLQAVTEELGNLRQCLDEAQDDLHECRNERDAIKAELADERDDRRAVAIRELQEIRDWCVAVVAERGTIGRHRLEKYIAGRLDAARNCKETNQ